MPLSAAVVATLAMVLSTHMAVAPIATLAATLAVTLAATLAATLAVTLAVQMRMSAIGIASSPRGPTGAERVRDVDGIMRCLAWRHGDSWAMCVNMAGDATPYDLLSDTEAVEMAELHLRAIRDSGHQMDATRMDDWVRKGLSGGPQGRSIILRMIEAGLLGEDTLAGLCRADNADLRQAAWLALGTAPAAEQTSSLATQLEQ